VPGDRGTERGDGARRSVVPSSLRAQGRSLWLPAVWTGLGAAVVCATAAIVAVAICWLPIAGPTGHTRSAVSAGLLTFLAALHGGITVDGTAAAFLPLGMLALVALVVARAGAGLADAAAAIGEQDPARLLLAAAAQVGSFTVACLIAVPVSTLGSSSAPFLGVGVAALLVFGLAGGGTFVWFSPLRGVLAARLPRPVTAAVRAAAAVLLWYLAAGALLVAASLVLHLGDVEAISRRLGGGWGGVAVLLLGLLAAPNAVIAGASYVAGPGFAVGSATTAGVFGVSHGTLPAFPLLGALPSGASVNPAGYALLVAAPVLAGTQLGRIAWRQARWADRFTVLAAGAAIAGTAMAVLAWQGGGAIGGGGLAAVGASPWQAGLAITGASLLAGALALGVAALWHLAAPGLEQLAELGVEDGPRLAVVAPAPATDDGPDAEELAG
jgi:hypothetical protein